MTKEIEKIPTPADTSLVKLPDYGEDSGDGFKARDKDDSATYPFLNLLQSNSPIVVEGKASAGDWYNTTTGQVFKKEQGFLFVPASWDRYFVKWVPRNDPRNEGKSMNGNGFRGLVTPGDPVIESSKTKTFGRYELSENDENLILQETFYMYGALSTENGEFDGFAVIGFPSKKIKPFKQWRDRLEQFSATVKAPIYAHLSRFGSKLERNEKGIFYVPEIKSADPRGLRESLLSPTDERYKAGKAFKALIMKKEAQINYAQSAAQASEDEGSDEELPF